jgi:hypothetical protein
MSVEFMSNFLIILACFETFLIIFVSLCFIRFTLFYPLKEYLCFAWLFQKSFALFEAKIRRILLFLKEIHCYFNLGYYHQLMILIASNLVFLLQLCYFLSFSLLYLRPRKHLHYQAALIIIIHYYFLFFLLHSYFLLVS